MVCPQSSSCGTKSGLLHDWDVSLCPEALCEYWICRVIWLNMKKWEQILGLCPHIQWPYPVRLTLLFLYNRQLCLYLPYLLLTPDSCYALRKGWGQEAWTFEGEKLTFSLCSWPKTKMGESWRRGGRTCCRSSKWRDRDLRVRLSPQFGRTLVLCNSFLWHGNIPSLRKLFKSEG